jgi:hypothetical protein
LRHNFHVPDGRKETSMSKKIIPGLVFGLAVLPLSALSAFAQNQSRNKSDDPAPATHATPDANKPGPEQAFLAKRAGEYTRTIRFVGQGGADANPFTGTAKISVALGGRFVVEENNDVVFGRPVSGLRIYGFNNVTKQYEAVWMYTMSTAMIRMTGTSDDGGKTIDLSGTSADLHSGAVPLHAVVRQVDDDEFVVTLMSKGTDGKEAAFQETTYTRRKSPN